MVVFNIRNEKNYEHTRYLKCCCSEGLMVAADEPNARKHMELESVPNLQVVARQSYGIYMYSRSSYTS
jgi:hypothetical protein